MAGLAACVTPFAEGPALAGGPTGGVVAGGSATISNPSATSTIINQASQKAIINWQNFSVSAGSSVTFNQPNAQAIALNRVLGTNLSTIDGLLTANGNVWIINPNGVLFGKGSRINVGSLIATTADMSDSDFMNGHYDFTKAGNPDAAITNEGTIRAADGGSVVLAGPVVTNDGLIQANLGSVTLAGTQAFTVDFQGDNLITFAMAAPQPGSGTPKQLSVSNSGTVSANGGRVVMTVRAAQDVADSVINNTGLVEATSVHDVNGTIVLDAGSGTATVSGTLDASGQRAGETGGAVTVTGNSVAIADGARIDASGSAGGGSIQIGGGLQGGGATPHAQATTVGNATLTADATLKGNGGTIAVWSDQSTDFAGTATARGGVKGGNGGLVETSGHDLHVADTARVDTSAPLGLTGDWLLDPNYIAISSGGSDGVGCSTSTCTITPTSIISALGTTNVTLAATNEIDVYSALIYSSANALSLLSKGDVYIAADVQNSGSGNINVLAGWDGTTFNSANFTNSGVFGNNGGTVYVTADYDLDPGDSGEAGSESDEVGPVAIGSASGTTTVAGYDVQLLSYYGDAQIGYRGVGTGAINVFASHDVLLLGEANANAIIGNGGIAVSGNVGGNIDVSAGTNVSVIGGADGTDGIAYIGNLGDAGESATPFQVSGNITVTAGGIIAVNANQISGEGVDEAWIGNTAYGSAGTVVGDVGITAGGDIQLDSQGNTTFTQIGNFARGASVGGTLNLVAGGDLLLTANGSSAYAQIGNLTYASGSSAAGDIAIQASGTLDLTEQNGGSVWLGNKGALETGNLTIIAHDEHDNGLQFGDIILANLGDNPNGTYISGAGGNVTVGFTDAGSDLTIDSGFAFNSPHTLSVLTASGIEITDSLQNSGSGAMNFVAGWSPAAVTADQLITATEGTSGAVAALFNGKPGAYGKNSATILIGGAAATGNVAVGSAGGTTSVFTNNMTLEADNGGSVLGYSGSGSGDIRVAANGTVTLTGGGATKLAVIGSGTTLSPGSDDITVSAKSMSVNAYHALVGDTASLTITAAGSVGTLAIPLQLYLNNFAITTAGGGVYASAPSSGLSIGVGANGVNLGGGTFWLSAAGPISQTQAILAGALNVRASSGAINLANSGNSFGVLTVGTSGSNAATVKDAAGVTVASANVGGTFTLSSGGAIGQSGAILANALNVSSTGGAINLANSANSFGTLTVGTSGSNAATVKDAAGVTVASANVGGTFTLSSGGAIGQSGAILANAMNVSSTGGAINLANLNNAFRTLTLSAAGNSAVVYDTASLVVAGATADGGLTLLTKGALTFGQSVEIMAGKLLAIAGWDGTTVTPAALTSGSAYGNNNGGIVIGGAGAAGGVAVGASGGATLAGKTITLSAVNGYAQFGIHGSGSGTLTAIALGDIDLQAGSGSGYYAQIGNGGYQTAGSNSGTITVQAGGDVNLSSGTADAAYTQIGHGGAESNANSAGYSDSGNITVTATNLNLVSGTGSAAYSQVGNGGYRVGAGLTGTSSLIGLVTVTAGHNVSLSGGGGGNAYSQIGNGGGFANTNAAAGAHGTTSGDIVVAAPSGTLGAVTVTAGAGSNAYSQIGNGGYSSNAPGAAPASNFVISGNVSITDLLLAGGNGGPNAFSQVGNGDAGHGGNANVSGNINIQTNGGSITLINGTSQNGSALIGNAIGTGTVTGTITGYTPPQSGFTPGSSGTITTLISTPPPTPTLETGMADLIQVSEQNQPGATGTETGGQPGPLEDMTQSSGSGGQSPSDKSDKAADELGNSLDGAKKKSSTEMFFGGLLTKLPQLPASGTPHGIPPADADFSSWGNEALWQ